MKDSRESRLKAGYDKVYRELAAFVTMKDSRESRLKVHHKLYYCDVM